MISTRWQGWIPVALSVGLTLISYSLNSSAPMASLSEDFCFPDFCWQEVDTKATIEIATSKIRVIFISILILDDDFS